MAQQVPIYSLGRIVGEHDTRLWRLLHHYVDAAREQVDMSATVRVGLDETSKSRGHDYVSVFVDIEERKVIFATPGKDAPLSALVRIFWPIRSIRKRLKSSAVTCHRPSLAGLSSICPMPGSPSTSST
jgi:hypothetical protein